ncbi:MAG: hypothetical protein V4474_02500 [Patescibacteria group bacterium]
MANQQLVDYIKAQVAAGVSRLDLEKAVTSAGWSPKDSAEAFAVAEGRAPAAPVVPQAPVTPAAPRPIAPVQPQPMRPATVQMDVVRAPRSLMWLWVLLGIVVIGIIAAAAYFFVPQVQTVVGFYLGQAPLEAPYTPPTTYVPPVDVATTTNTAPIVPPATTTSTTTQ